MGVEVFQGQTERIHAGVAGSAERLLAMHGQGFADGGFAVFEAFFGFFEGGDVGGRGRGGHAEDVIEDELAAFDRGGAGGVGSDDKDRAHGEQSAARAVFGEGDCGAFRCR